MSKFCLSIFPIEETEIEEAQQVGLAADIVVAFALTESEGTVQLSTLTTHEQIEAKNYAFIMYSISTELLKEGLYANLTEEQKFALVKLRDAFTLKAENPS